MRIAFNLSFLLLVGLLPSLATAGRIIEREDPPPITVPAGLGATAVADAIKSALKKRDWTFTTKTPGVIVAKQSRRDFDASVRIQYSAQTVSLAYLDSRGLDHRIEDGKAYIHGTYVRWTRNLARDITEALSAAQP